MESSREVRATAMHRTGYSVDLKPPLRANISLGVDSELLGKAFQVSFLCNLTL